MPARNLKGDVSAVKRNSGSIQSLTPELEITSVMQGFLKRQWIVHGITPITFHPLLDQCSLLAREEVVLVRKVDDD